ncbi:hypothetical protein EVAR_50001_1 [Eumeta japonica]|uniref:Uncharacterized protein n=1 Tax=Eumeta variegata TaxID=151549 RepID=A0A4C1XRK6_EUMVA|nr:hypothetical protein EVAR_50001_1 [Eumeta japonica]
MAAHESYVPFLSPRLLSHARKRVRRPPAERDRRPRRHAVADRTSEPCAYGRARSRALVANSHGPSALPMTRSAGGSKTEISPISRCVHTAFYRSTVNSTAHLGPPVNNVGPET